MRLVVGDEVVHVPWPHMRDKLLRTIAEMEAQEAKRRKKKEDDASSR